MWSAYQRLPSSKNRIVGKHVDTIDYIVSFNNLLPDILGGICPKLSMFSDELGIWNHQATWSWKWDRDPNKSLSLLTANLTPTSWLNKTSRTNRVSSNYQLTDIIVTNYTRIITQLAK